MPQKTHFHGIVAVGCSQVDAVNRYRLLAMGKGAAAQVDTERSAAFVTHASHAEHMFNPNTGDMDLEQDPSILAKVEFTSNSSAEVEVNHLVCTAGCGAHIVFDSEDFVKFCPQCTSSLSEGGEDEEDFSDDEDEEAESADADFLALIDSESDDEEEEEPKEESDEEEEELSVEESESSGNVVAFGTTYALAQASFLRQLPLTSKSGEIPATYKVCSESECGLHVLSSDDVELCPSCSSELVEPEVGDDEPEVPAVKEEVKESAEEAADDAEEAPAEEEAADKAEDEKADKDEKAEEAPSDSESADEAPAEPIEEAAKDADPSKPEPKKKSSFFVLDTKEETVDVPEEVSENADVALLDVSYSSSIGGKSAWTAYYEGRPVFMARAADAGDNADLFDQPQFGHAVLATAKVAGVGKALKELGFKPLVRTVSLSAEVGKLVEAAVQEEQAKLASESAEYKERFQAALATAAVGLNRGFFAGKSNPVKAALWNAMSSAGIKNPEVLIDNAFRTHGDPYHKALFALAGEIMSKPSDVQESLASTVLDMGYQSASSAVSSGSLEDRLAGLGVSTSSEAAPAPVQEVKQTSNDKIHRVVSGLGRRGF